MDLLERYLQAVGRHLPGKNKMDTLAELRANLLAEMEGREEELGRPLTEDEVSAVLEQHGMPLIVASRYMPQHYLIGPGLFPLYWYTLLRSFPLVVLAYAVAQVANYVFAGGVSIGAAIGHFPYVAFTFWAVMTLGFAVFEYGQGKFFSEVKCAQAWHAKSLPPLTKEKEKGPSFASRVADFIVSVLIILWLLSIPTHPYLILGPGGSVHGLPFGLSPEWHIFYWQIVGLLALMLPLKFAALFRSGWRKVLELATQAIGILVLVVMVQARSYFAPGTGGNITPDVAASINSAVNLGFRVVLAITVVKFLWDVWQAIASSRTGQKGFVTVL
jgi:hypothetical protein